MFMLSFSQWFHCTFPIFKVNITRIQDHMEHQEKPAISRQYHSTSLSYVTEKWKLHNCTSKDLLGILALLSTCFWGLLQSPWKENDNEKEDVQQPLTWMAERRRTPSRMTRKWWFCRNVFCSTDARKSSTDRVYPFQKNWRTVTTGFCTVDDKTIPVVVGL